MADNPLLGSAELSFGDGSETFEVYQDADTCPFDYDYSTRMTNSAPMPDLVPLPKSHRRALDAVNSNTVLKPQPTYQSHTTPSKSKTTTVSGPALAPGHSSKLNRVPMPPPAKARQTDELVKKPFLSNFKTRPKRASLDGLPRFSPGAPVFSAAPTYLPSTETSTSLNANGKRELLEPSPLAPDTQPPDETKAQQDVPTVPRWDSFPPIIDDGAKPPHSYAQLIAMAILRSPTGKLTLSSIYKWISDTYSFYNPNDPGWQNSIRHNLSLHKSFRKTSRPKGDPGKGNYWAIEPGLEQQFLKDKPKGKSTPSGENLPVMSTRLEPSMPATAPTSEPTLPPPVPASHGPHQASSQMMPSSDATIPDAENALAEEMAENPGDRDPICKTFFSPAPPGVSSSPPVPRHDYPANGTPPPGRHASRPRKKAAESGVDDSGYISSLDSSVVRPNNGTAGWTSSARPRKKRKNSESGRAEVEIARLRNSSPFSPTKSRSKTSFPPISSSPLRQSTATMNPLTPQVKMRPPLMAPPSVSPNTNLRNHRSTVQNMLQTKASQLLAEEEAEPYSPKFVIGDPDRFFTGEFADSDDELWKAGMADAEGWAFSSTDLPPPNPF